MERVHTPGRTVPRTPDPWLTTGVVAAVFAGSLIGSAHVLPMPGGAGAAVVWFCCIVVLVAPQLVWLFRGHAGPAKPLGYAVLAGQAVIAYLPVLIFGQAWVGMPGFLAGSVLLVLPPVLGWTSFALVVASMAFAQWTFTGAPLNVLYTAISTITVGLVVYGLSGLTAFVREAHESRARVARTAVLRERSRFARDLHDLLGYSLSAISHKIELAHRTMDTSPQEARDQLLEALEISRVAYCDARTVVSGYRELSLEEECRSVVSVLSAAGIQVWLDGEPSDMPVKASTVLATVLREGATNLLRHSKATTCRIMVGQADDRAWIEIVNDNPVTPSCGQDGDSGRDGLRNLSARAGQLGGWVSVERRPGLFRLHAEVPLRTGHSAAARSEPARLTSDPDRIDAVAGGDLADDRGQVVPNGPD